jgi:hypothetical protein
MTRGQETESEDGERVNADAVSTAGRRFTRHAPSIQLTYAYENTG